MKWIIIVCHVLKQLSLKLFAKFDGNLFSTFKIKKKTFGLLFVDMVSMSKGRVLVRHP